MSLQSDYIQHYSSDNRAKSTTAAENKHLHLCLAAIKETETHIPADGWRGDVRLYPRLPNLTLKARILCNIV